MGINTIFIAALAVTSTVTATPARLFQNRAVGDTCTGDHGKGTCESTSSCKGISYADGYCPEDPEDIQCCVEIPCADENHREGFLASKARGGCSDGELLPPYSNGTSCPADPELQCCIREESDDDDDEDEDSSSSDIGQQILDQAREAAGIPYAWGGGSCDGPTGDIAPYDYGDVGFDCSGLVNWALCQVTGTDVFGTSMRVTTGMYCDMEDELGFQKLPYDDRQAGDAVFFGDPCDCSGGVYHVGLVTEDLDLMWNAPNDDINEPIESEISGPCDYVVRLYEA